MQLCIGDDLISLEFARRWIPHDSANKTEFRRGFA